MRLGYKCVLYGKRQKKQVPGKKKVDCGEIIQLPMNLFLILPWLVE